jgi:hypothetical protein
MEKLEKYDLKGIPPKVFVDIKEEIDFLNLKFSLLKKEFKTLKTKLVNNNKNKIKVDSFTKIRLLLNNFDIIVNDIEEIIVSLDLDNEWTLTDNDINRINNNRETNNLFKTFLPYMLTYKVMNDVNNNISKKNT